MLHSHKSFVYKKDKPEVHFLQSNARSSRPLFLGNELLCAGETTRVEKIVRRVVLLLLRKMLCRKVCNIFALDRSCISIDLSKTLRDSSQGTSSRRQIRWLLMLISNRNSHLGLTDAWYSSDEKESRRYYVNESPVAARELRTCDTLDSCAAIFAIFKELRYRRYERSAGFTIISRQDWTAREQISRGAFLASLSRVRLIPYWRNEMTLN